MKGAQNRLGVIFLTLALSGCFNRPPDHGTCFLLELDAAHSQTAQQPQQVLETTVKALSRRMGGFSVRHSVEATGTNQIALRIATAPEADMEVLRKTLLRGGELEFCLVQERPSMLSAQVTGPGYETVTKRRTLRNGQTAEENLTIKRPAEMVGGIKSAKVLQDSLGRPEIGFTFGEEATKDFARITRENVGRRLAIVMGEQVLSVQTIRAAIEQGSGVIQSDFSPAEASALAMVLEVPLTTGLKIIKEESF